MSNAAAETAVETLTQAGGRRWTKGTADRVYLAAADAMALAGWQVTRYGTGSIADVRDARGHRVSNTVAREIANCKFYYDVTTGRFHSQGAGRKIASEVSEIVRAVAAHIRGEA